MRHDNGSTAVDEQCQQGSDQECRERGTSDCRREGGRGRGGGQCRRGHAESVALPASGDEGAARLPSNVLTHIAVCATGPSLADRVHERFGRAEFFQFIDCTTMATRVVTNDGNRAGTDGAGIGAVELLAENGAHVAIVTKVGPKAVEAFTRAGITVFNGGGLTVGEAVAAYLRGDLTCMDQK